MDLSILLAILKHWNIDVGELVDEHKLNRRIRVQKLIHLFQNKKFGEDSLYAYGMYFHGPYSPALTREYYQLAEKQELHQPSTLRDTTIQSLNEVLTESASFAQSHGMQEIPALELLSTVLFYAKLYPNDDDIIEAVIIAKPLFKEFRAKVIDALCFLRDNHYL